VRARDAQRLAQPPRPGAQQALVVQPAPFAHLRQSGQRLQRADQHAGAVALLAADKIQTPVQAVRAVHIAAPRRPEHGKIARRRAVVAVRGRLAAVVGLGLDDAPADAVHQQGDADQLPRHLGRGRAEIDACKVCIHGHIVKAYLAWTITKPITNDYQITAVNGN